MLSPIVGQVTLGIYAVLLAVGGVIGFTKAGSKALADRGGGQRRRRPPGADPLVQNRTLGMGLACLLAILLFVFFGYRYAAKTRKFMPAGLLSVVSLVVLVISILALQ